MDQKECDDNYCLAYRIMPQMSAASKGCQRNPQGTHLKKARELGAAEGHKGALGICTGIDAHAQGGQGQVDALRLCGPVACKQA